MTPPPPLHSNNIPLLAVAATLLYVSHSFDFAYLGKSMMLTLRMKSKPSIPDDPQLAAYHFLQWYVTSSKVSTRDLDFNYHMSNSRYSRHGDFARFKLVLETDFLPALHSLGCGLVVSAITQKFRRELPYAQEYQVWARFVGWDERHFYVEHVFVFKKDDENKTTKQNHGSTNLHHHHHHHAIETLDHDSSSSNTVTLLDGSEDAVRRVVNLTTQKFHEQSSHLVIASILTTRLTTTRVAGNMITPRQVLHRLGLADVLSSVAPPPEDTLQWNTSIERFSDRYTKPTPMLSKL